MLVRWVLNWGELHFMEGWCMCRFWLHDRRALSKEETRNWLSFGIFLCMIKMQCVGHVNDSVWIVDVLKLKPYQQMVRGPKLWFMDLKIVKIATFFLIFKNVWTWIDIWRVYKIVTCANHVPCSVLSLVYTVKHHKEGSKVQRRLHRLAHV